MREAETNYRKGFLLEYGILLCAIGDDSQMQPHATWQTKLTESRTTPPATPSTWPISTPIGSLRAFPVSESMSVGHSVRLMRSMKPRNPKLRLLQIIARGTLCHVSYVSSTTCAVTSYPESTHVGERSAMQSSQPVWLYTRVKMSRAELVFGSALTGSRTVVMNKTTVLSADAQMLSQETYLVGRQRIRHGTNIVSTYTSCVGLSEAVGLASRLTVDARTFVAALGHIIRVDKLDGRNEELGSLWK